MVVAFIKYKMVIMKKKEIRNDASNYLLAEWIKIIKRFAMCYFVSISSSLAFLYFILEYNSIH